MKSHLSHQAAEYTIDMIKAYGLTSWSTFLVEFIDSKEINNVAKQTACDYAWLRVMEGI